MEVNGQLEAQADLPLVTIKQKAGWAQEPVWTFR